MSAAVKVSELGFLSSDGNSGRDPVRFVLDMIRDNGDCVRYETKFGKVTLFNHPSQVQVVMKNENLSRISFLRIPLGNGLLTSEGRLWRSQRKLAQPLFSRSHISSTFSKLVIDRTLSIMESWPSTDTGDPFDLFEEMSRITLAVITSAMFSYELDDELNEKVRRAIRTVMVETSGLACLPYAIPWTFSASRQNQYDDALAFVDGVFEDIIDDRRKDKSPPDDLLTRLLAARTDEGEPLSGQQLRDEVVTMMVAGNETTSVALAWTWYLLSQHPGAEDRLHHEVDTVLEGREPMEDDVARLQWTSMTVKESMRLFPPIWSIARRADIDETVAGVRLSAGESVLVCPYTIHRHPEYWDEPESFRPERWAPENLSSRQQAAYLPFGAGRHLCLGIHFALMEATLVVASVARRFHVRPLSEAPVEMDPGITLRIRNGLLVRLEPRDRPYRGSMAASHR